VSTRRPVIIISKLLIPCENVTAAYLLPASGTITNITSNNKNGMVLDNATDLQEEDPVDESNTDSCPRNAESYHKSQNL